MCILVELFNASCFSDTWSSIISLLPNRRIKLAKMSSTRRKNGIPDRWLDYQAVGKRLQGTRFIAFKVPLKFSLNCQLSSGDVFGHWELLDTVKRENQELGLIIDLTFTTRYYKPEDVPESLHCVKIFTAGHEIPSDSTILTFKRTVRQFLQENGDNDKLIGVHCTHGLNRTGYLICRYLIDVDEVEPHKAIQLFNSSRGHAMERKNYLEDLLSGPKRSNEGIEESEMEPVQGSATHRPVYSEETAGSMEERPSFSHESSQYRRRKHRHGHTWREGNRTFAGSSSGGPGLLPTPGAPAFHRLSGGPRHLPPPAFPPANPSFSPYRWAGASTPPQPNGPWPGARGSGHSLHGFSAPPRPSQWTNDSGRFTSAGSEQWGRPKTRSHVRHGQRKNQYDYSG